ncbi:uncharacterized protein J3D65DRAFT_561027 [Phyllosticta citribraziliensis]|uniref:Cyclase n=1 Tax=Phyllosticta citribraziliensis TaxID=989973 RepID=A0ABR1L6R3_9PEZI
MPAAPPSPPNPSPSPSTSPPQPPYRYWPHAPSSHAEGLGRLALLTPAVVASAASSQIRCGRRVGLNWEMTKLECAAFGRQEARHRIVGLFGGGGEGKGEKGKEGGGEGTVAFDDIYEFNPQQSSQWDGLRHFSQPGDAARGEDPQRRFFYGGTTAAEIVDRGCERIGMQHWAAEGIAGRGVLIDYAAYAAERGIRYSAFSPHAIELGDIQAVAKECGVVFECGDILFVRVGVTKEWEGMGREQKEAFGASEAPTFAGVEGTVDVLGWLWETGFAAVAGDSVSWEVSESECVVVGFALLLSAADIKQVFPAKDVLLHEYLLAGWGMPIGEMFDLEALAATCRELGRWTFFVASMPLNMPGGVSSPPNAMAIF